MYALLSNISGNYNTAVGINALSSNTTGFNNTGVGNLCLVQNISGFSNAAIGNSALYTNVSGTYNTAIGYGADVASGALENATAIGSQSQVNCSNCMVLGSVNGMNFAFSDVNVGIGETTPRFPLNFRSSLGDKISLYGNTPGGPHYGFGIQSGLLEIHAATSSDDVGFGYGSSSAFTETMRIKGNNTGIVLPGAEQPIITRAYDPFTSGPKNGVGRWGMFIEPSHLTLGIPEILRKEYSTGDL